jgi:hypothetical protein
MQQWIAGAVSKEGPDASGNTTYHAADGNYIVVRSNGTLAMRGFRPPASGAQSQPSEQAAAAPAQPSTGVGAATQQQLEARIAQLPGLVYQGQAMKTKTIPGLPGLPDKQIQVPVVTWINPSTGQTLTAEVESGGGSYTITQDGVIPSNKRADASTTAQAEPPKTEDRGGRRYVWQPNPGGPSAGGQWVDAGTAPETPTERQAREANAPSQSVRTETGGDGKPYTVITIVPKPGQPGSPGQIVLGPDGQPAPGGIPGKPPVEKREPVTKNGKTYIQVTVQHPDGRSELYFTDQSGARVTLPDQAQMPANAPAFAPDWQKPGLGLIEYASAVRARPDLTDDQKATLIQQAHTLATSTVAQGNAVLSAQQAAANQQTTERGQNVSLANQRLSSASTDFSTAQRAATEATKYALGDDARHVLPYYMALAHAAGSAYGGFNTPPPVQQGAAIRQMQGQTIPGMPTRESPISGFIPLPGAPAGQAQGADPMAADAEARRQAAMENPVFRPQPPVELGAGATATGLPPTRDDWRLHPIRPRCS